MTLAVFFELLCEFCLGGNSCSTCYTNPFWKKPFFFRRKPFGRNLSNCSWTPVLWTPDPVFSRRFRRLLAWALFLNKMLFCPRHRVHSCRDSAGSLCCDERLGPRIFENGVATGSPHPETTLFLAEKKI